MHQRGGLLGNGLGQCWVTVTNTACCYTRTKIEVAMTIVIPQTGTFTFYCSNREVGIGSEDM